MKREKTGGRQKGTPNKLTFQTRQVLMNALNYELNNLPMLLEQLKPIERVDAILRLSRLILPPVNSVASSEADLKGLVCDDKAVKKYQKQIEIDEMFDSNF